MKYLSLLLLSSYLILFSNFTTAQIIENGERNPTWGV